MFKPPSLKHFSPLSSQGALENKMLLMNATLNRIVDSSNESKDHIREALESYAKVHFLDFLGVFIHSEKCTSHKCAALWIFTDRPLNHQPDQISEHKAPAKSQWWLLLKYNHYLDFWPYMWTLLVCTLYK